MHLGAGVIGQARVDFHCANVQERVVFECSYKYPGSSARLENPLCLFRPQKIDHDASHMWGREVLAKWRFLNSHLYFLFCEVGLLVELGNLELCLPEY